MADGVQLMNLIRVLIEAKVVCFLKIYGRSFHPILYKQVK